MARRDSIASTASSAASSSAAPCEAEAGDLATSATSSRRSTGVFHRLARFMTSSRRKKAAARKQAADATRKASADSEPLYAETHRPSICVSECGSDMLQPELPPRRYSVQVAADGNVRLGGAGNGENQAAMPTIVNHRLAQLRTSSGLRPDSAAGDSGVDSRTSTPLTNSDSVCSLPRALRDAPATSGAGRSRSPSSPPPIRGHRSSHDDDDDDDDDPTYQRVNDRAESPLQEVLPADAEEQKPQQQPAEPASATPSPPPPTTPTNVSQIPAFKRQAYEDWSCCSQVSAPKPAEGGVQVNAFLASRNSSTQLAPLNRSDALDSTTPAEPDDDDDDDDEITLRG